jgi:hypothetical protein
MTTPELKPAGEIYRSLKHADEWYCHRLITLDGIEAIRDEAIRWAADMINVLHCQDSPRLGLREKLLKRWEETR